LSGSESKVELHPLPGDDPKQREPDISKAQTLLNWNPTVTRAQGLEITMEYFRGVI